jgi:site-specific DNA-methyltransferase (adenine-specific)
MAYNGGENFPHQIIGKPIVASPNTACTQTYLVAGMYDSAHEAENFAAFLRTRFARFMISMRKITQHAKPGSFAFVPKLDMTVRWTDQMLYQRYGLAQDEIDFIESRIKEMS